LAIAGGDLLAGAASLLDLAYFTFDVRSVFEGGFRFPADWKVADDTLAAGDTD